MLLNYFIGIALDYLVKKQESIKDYTKDIEIHPNMLTIIEV